MFLIWKKNNFALLLKFSAIKLDLQKVMLASSNFHALRPHFSSPSCDQRTPSKHYANSVLRSLFLSIHKILHTHTHTFVIHTEWGLKNISCWRNNKSARPRQAIRPAPKHFDATLAAMPWNSFLPAKLPAIRGRAACGRKTIKSNYYLHNRKQLWHRPTYFQLEINVRCQRASIYFIPCIHKTVAKSVILSWD